jgi:hypothetical protein
MAKMSKTQQENVRAAHANLNSNGRQIATTARGREYLWNNGWMAPNLRPTTAGLIAAGVDMDAIETEAHKENNRREADERASILARHAAEVRDLAHAEAWDEHAERGHVDNRAEIGAARTQRFHGLVKIARSFTAALDILHAEALVEDFTRRPFMVRAHEISEAERKRASGSRGRALPANDPHSAAYREQAHDEALHHLRKDCPAPLGMCERCTSPAAVRAARGDDSAYHCGRPWVVKIQKCPRCGLTADKHPVRGPSC